jgi:acetyl esterase
MLVRNGTNAASATPSLADRIQFSAARALGHLSPRTQRRLAGAPITIDGDTLDPGLQLMLKLRERRGVTPFRAMTPERARRYVRAESRIYSGPRPPVKAVHHLEVPGAAGPLKARHYVPPEPGGPHPLLLFLHGGGFVVGDLDTHDVPCRLLCRHGGVHVLSVEYRKAPEHPFPAAVHDATAALAWAHEHASELKADPTRIAIGGDSAGGNLSAVATRLAVRDGTPAPVLQVLIYPATDIESEWPSVELFAQGFYLTRDDRDWYHEHYMSGASEDDPLGSPLLSGDLQDLPPALVVTAAFDPLRDEGEAYANALREAGSPVILRRFPGLVHGFINMTAINPASHDALVEVAGGVRALLARARERETT